MSVSMVSARRTTSTGPSASMPVSLKKSLKQCFQSALVSLGETLCCDEVLFRFTGKGGIVRKVPNKPARVGIYDSNINDRLGMG